MSIKRLECPFTSLADAGYTPQAVMLAIAFRSVGGYDSDLEATSQLLASCRALTRAAEASFLADFLNGKHFSDYFEDEFGLRPSIIETAREHADEFLRTRGESCLAALVTRGKAVVGQ